MREGSDHLLQGRHPGRRPHPGLPLRLPGQALPRCEYALYDSAAQLERALNALTYAANECRDDLKSYCADVKPGEGRLRDCLGKNEAKLNARCKAALKDVGLK
jgi:hypothetical protein